MTGYWPLTAAPKPTQTPWPADPGKETMPRVAIEATLQCPMGALRVTTTHLEYYSDVQRRAQALRLRNLHDEPARAPERDALRRELARLVAEALGL